MIELEGVDVSFAANDGGDIPALQGISLRLPERRVALIGPNGSGKSTVARLVNGLVEPTRGSVVVDGIDVVRHSVRARRHVGFMFTDPAAQLVMPTVAEDIELSLRRRIRNRPERRDHAVHLLEEYGLGGMADRSVHALSGGQRQLLALAGVLATEPAVLVADEPTTLLDLANSRRIGDLLLGLPQQLVLVTHDLDLAARCDRAILVRDGRIAADGPPADVIAGYRAQP